MVLYTNLNLKQSNLIECQSKLRGVNPLFYGQKIYCRKDNESSFFFNRLDDWKLTKINCTCYGLAIYGKHNY